MESIDRYDAELLTPTMLNDLSNDMKSKFGFMLDKLGRESAISQQLNDPITSLEKLLSPAAASHNLIICRNNDNIIGYLKYGKKDLYFYKKDGKVVQSSPICLLDFYVSDIYQRQGIGLLLFKNMLEVLSINPCVFAYDRPSPKLISFLAKHYDMKNGDLQPNRFMIFDGFLL